MAAPLKEPPREEMEDETLRFAPEFEIGYGTLSYKDENFHQSVRCTMCNPRCIAVKRNVQRN
jgi:hypothetical protein